MSTVTLISIICIIVTHVYSGESILISDPEEQNYERMIQVYIQVCMTWIKLYDTSKAIFFIPILLMLFYASRHLDTNTISKKAAVTFVLMKENLRKDIHTVASEIGPHYSKIVSIFRYCSFLLFIQPVTVVQLMLDKA